jgi:hypothetical protein
MKMVELVLMFPVLKFRVLPTRNEFACYLASCSVGLLARCCAGHSLTQLATALWVITCQVQNSPNAELNSITAKTKLIINGSLGCNHLKGWHSSTDKVGHKPP